MKKENWGSGGDNEVTTDIALGTGGAYSYRAGLGRETNLKARKWRERFTKRFEDKKKNIFTMEWGLKKA